MSRELYVYYRVAAADAGAAQAAVAALFAQLRRDHPALSARLLRRPPADAPAEQTWMEVYAQPGAGVDAALQARIEAAAHATLGALVRGERHAEVFTAF